MNKLKREHSHLIGEQTRALHDVTDQQDQTKARMDELVRAKAEVDTGLKTSRDRVTILKEDVEWLMRQIHSLPEFVPFGSMFKNGVENATIWLRSVKLFTDFANDYTGKGSAFTGHRSAPKCSQAEIYGMRGFS